MLDHNIERKAEGCDAEAQDGPSQLEEMCPRESEGAMVGCVCHWIGFTVEVGDGQNLLHQQELAMLKSAMGIRRNTHHLRLSGLHNGQRLGRAVASRLATQNAAEPKAAESGVPT